MNNCRYCNKPLRKGSAPNFHKVCYQKWLYANTSKTLLDPWGLYLPPCLRKK